MSSIPGLPHPGSQVTILISRVHMHAHCVQVEFWGKFSQNRLADYQLLAKNLQSAGTKFKNAEGKPGDKCLVQIENNWYRSRIVSRTGPRYSVFLIDQGMTYNVTTNALAWGEKEHFQLPPEVEFCVLANTLPLSLENRWSPRALEFLQTLAEKSVTAQVQDVLVSHRMFVLHIPGISHQMYELGLARKVSPDAFRDFVLLSLNSHDTGESPLVVQLQKSSQSGKLFLYPELSGGTLQNVVVTEVRNPQKIFCQLKIFTQELQKLCDQLTQSCEGRSSDCKLGPEMVGSPCAARGADGKWHRSILQQVFTQKNLVEVLNVDYGTKQLVQMENVRPLATEFFRMPVITYICSLHGLIDKGEGWTANQINFLRSLLMNKVLLAKFEYQSISEGVYYVTFYGDDNTNLNNLFGSRESCLLEFEKTPGEYTVKEGPYKFRQPYKNKEMVAAGEHAEHKDRKPERNVLPVEELSLNSSHTAVVQHVSSPSEFWIQVEPFGQKLHEILDTLAHFYQDSVSTDLVRTPTLGLICAAKAEDGVFYRASVIEVSDTKVKVFFVDFGNTGSVYRNDIRPLPPELLKLPRLAVKCSLDGVKPKGGKWSQSASDFFTEIVTDKELNIQVKAKQKENYAVQLTDTETQGLKDVATLMCLSGLAEKTDVQTRFKVKSTPTAALPVPAVRSDPSPFSSQPKSGSSLLPEGMVGNLDGNKTPPAFKEKMFPVGRVLDVFVSFSESPNEFWCQLVQNAVHLKLLMHDMQAYYASSKFQPNVDVTCVVQHPENGMWYRALMVNKHSASRVDVLLVDYGQTLTVTIYDVRRITPQFLSLQSQAFRCSLLNPIYPTSAINEWSLEAKQKFCNFVETATANFVLLKCTIHAIMCSEQMVVYNIVDLTTPFESICTSLANLLTSVPQKKPGGASFRLNTYYYSTHNVKRGTEEPVTVTYVKNVNQFYCHLDKNADVMKNLKERVSNLCQQLEKQKLPTVFGALCFAKYSDGEWYRAQIKKTNPKILVHFVDYGDTIEVEKADLLPVPKEAHGIMSVPVQAVMCSLSDIPAHVPDDVNSWFEMTAQENKFRALIVAREQDGKLVVELYNKNSQINSKIKKMFHIEMKTEQRVICQSWALSEMSASHPQKMAKFYPKQATGAENQRQPWKKNQFSQKPAHQMRVESNVPMYPQPPQKTQHKTLETGTKMKPTLELYKPPHLRPNSRSSSPDASSETEQPKSKQPGVPSEEDTGKLPKLADLPPKTIKPDTTLDVYVSYCDGPLSFYVQCQSEEDEIISVAEKLNSPEEIPEVGALKDLEPGDLVQALFAEDSFWYRAVVKEIHDNGTAVIEFIDFGNGDVMPISKMARLPNSLLEFPRYSTHCMLGGAAAAGEANLLNPDVVSAFKEDVGATGEKSFQCQFVKQVGSVWEVLLKEEGVDVVCKIPAGDPYKEPCSLHYANQQEFDEGQQLKIEVTTINDCQTFWCINIQAEEMGRIKSEALEIGNEAGKHVRPEALLPGCPCLAPFPEDQLWYRAEVIGRDGDELELLFVDYGDRSPVKITDVKEIPPALLDIPPQAFLCELQGFDSQRGSWDTNAADELYALTVDKFCMLTIVSKHNAEGTIKYSVKMECEGKMINELMTTYWNCSTAEDPEPHVKVEDTNEQQAPVQDVTDTPSCPQPTDTETVETSSKLASSPKSCDVSVDFVSVESPEEESFTEENVTPSKDVLLADSGIEESIPYISKEDEAPIANVEAEMVENNKDFESPLMEKTQDELKVETTDEGQMKPSAACLEIKSISDHLMPENEEVSQKNLKTTGRAATMVPRCNVPQETAEIKEVEFEDISPGCEELPLCGEGFLPAPLQSLEGPASDPNCSNPSLLGKDLDESGENCSGAAEKVSEIQQDVESPTLICEEGDSTAHDQSFEDDEKNEQSVRSATPTQTEAEKNPDSESFVEEPIDLNGKACLTDIQPAVNVSEDNEQEKQTPQENKELEKEDGELAEELPLAVDSLDAQQSGTTQPSPVLMENADPPPPACSSL